MRDWPVGDLELVAKTWLMCSDITAYVVDDGEIQYYNVGSWREVERHARRLTNALEQLAELANEEH